DDVLPLLKGSVDWRIDELKQWIVNTATTASRKDVAHDRAQRCRAILDKFFRLLAAFLPGVDCEYGGLSERFAGLVKTDHRSLPIDQLSQGTGSVIGWVGTLLKRLDEIYDKDDPTRERALVLIDEVDAHMHPAWQRLLVPTLQEHFPGLQVIATTHSPLIVANMRLEDVAIARRA